MEVTAEGVAVPLEMSPVPEEDGLNSDGDYESLPAHVSVVNHMTAGAVAGILEHTVMYPVDSVKVTQSHEGLF